MAEPGARFEFTVKAMAFIPEDRMDTLIVHVHEENAVIVLKMGPMQRWMIERQQMGKPAA